MNPFGAPETRPISNGFLKATDEGSAGVLACEFMGRPAPC